MFRRSPLPRSLPFHSVRRSQPHRTLVAPPSSNSGPLMYRRADRELPDVTSYSRFVKTLPIFIVILGASALAIFNYQKSSSSIVNSTLYALRTSPRAREVLGDEIYFRDKFPWIWGEMNQFHGKIDIEFAVKGTKATGRMRFRSVRRKRLGFVSLNPVKRDCSLRLLDADDRYIKLDMVLMIG